MNITPELLAQAITLLQQGGAFPKAAVSVDKKAKLLSDKDKKLVAGFHRKGFKDVVLMDRNDPSKPFNVRPFQGWIKEGRIVRKGEHGVRGLFHISQTEPVTAAPAKPKEGKFAIPVKAEAKTEAKPQIAGKSLQEALAKMMATAKPEIQPAA